MLDEAAIALEAAIFAITGVIAGVSRVAAEAIAAEAEASEEVRGILEHRRTGANREAMEACAAARDRMMLSRQRIAIRLGASEDLNAGYGAGATIVIDIIRELHAKQREQDAGGVPLDEDFADRINDLARVRGTFILHAVERVGSQV